MQIFMFGLSVLENNRPREIDTLYASVRFTDFTVIYRPLFQQQHQHKNKQKYKLHLQKQYKHETHIERTRVYIHEPELYLYGCTNVHTRRTKTIRNEEHVIIECS